MKILILEDDDVRVAEMMPLLVGHDVTRIISSADPIETHYDLYLLDHDLGGRQLEDHEDSGTAFANKYAEQIRKNEALALIHSFNPVGANRMRDIIGGAYALVAPFGTARWKLYLKEALGLLEGRDATPES